MKRKWLHELPYLLIALYATKIGQAWRLAAGTAFAEKFLHWGDGFMQALASPLPSFHPQDVLAGMAIAAAFYAAVYVKGRNAKKFRHNVEYGSARWGTAKDIEFCRSNTILKKRRTEKLREDKNTNNSSIFRLFSVKNQGVSRVRMNHANLLKNGHFGEI